MDFEKQRFDVVILAGQSNAEGNGVRSKDVPEKRIDGVYELIDANVAYPYFDEKENATKLVVTMPTEFVLREARERTDGENFRSDISETFAADYIAAGRLKAGRKILIVKAAVGGTGFALGQWGVGNPLWTRMVGMIDYALGLNPENRVVAFLWHQGEHDAFEQAWLSPEERYAFYVGKYKQQCLAVRNIYGDVPVICGGFVDHWAEKPENKSACDAVEKALYDVSVEIGKSAFVGSEGLLSNDQLIKNGDDIHFCYKSVYELGHRYFSAFEKIV